MYDHIGALAALIIAAILLVAGVVTHLRRESSREAAMRRHPSARTAPDFTSEAARKYHESNQLGRN